MPLRAAKLLVAVTLLAGLWGVSTVGPPGSAVWLQPSAPSPGQVRILRFYASVGAVSPGQSAMLCYGVENARSVRISPPVAGAFPASRRCLQIVPQHTTHYTIWAEGFDGRVAMQSLTLPVEALPQAPPNWLNYAELPPGGWERFPIAAESPALSTI